MPKQRQERDFYPTPATIKLIEPVINFVSKDEFCVEPCAGDGSLYRVFEEAGFSMTCYDIEPQFENCLSRDALEGIEPCDWVITNPPYKLAVPIIERSLEAARVGVAMLLRLSFIEPCPGRRHLLEKLNYFCPVNPRPKFLPESTDNVTSAWLIWEHGSDRKEFDFCVDWR